MVVDGLLPAQPRVVLEKSEISQAEKFLLKRLLSLTPDLTTYQSGPKAPAQIISNGKYVLKDAGEIRKFQADLQSFIKTPDSQGRSRLMSTEDITPDLIKFLKSKGYKESNIKADFQARISSTDNDSRSQGVNLNKVDPEANIVNSIKGKLFDKGFLPDVEKTVKDAFMALLDGSQEYSLAFINNVAESEKNSKPELDGSSAHKYKVVERLDKIEHALMKVFNEENNIAARDKVAALIPRQEYLPVTEGLAKEIQG